MEDIVALRQAKIATAIASIHDRIQSSLIACGLDATIARMVASDKIWSLYYSALPVNLRASLDTMITEAQAELNTVIPNLIAANTKLSLDAASPTPRLPRP